MDNFKIVIIAATFVVFVVLVFGIINLASTKDEARSKSNKLMRLRVIAQFVAILLLAASIWYKGQH